eukprot:TRINITY_DN20987_c0_g1_i1.p1 TRINITY_DN20987_c0_g1~~TRINITY_DN20987_c0_g1_i1.p1  ORF type:complete len:341 (-),score=67.09 TRINITY_DN20987_c0_g1_i1:263-1231(-)
MANEPRSSRNGGFTVALGGCWQELEERNSALRALLQTSESELALAESARAQAIQAEEHFERSEVAEHTRRHQVEEEAGQLRCEVLFLRTALSEASQAGEEATSKAQASSSHAVSLRDEFAESQAALERESLAASSLRGKLAAIECRASCEASALAEAVARSECLSAELQVAEARFCNRGTHVDLLLRDKTRLWSQLEKLRKKNDSSNDAPARAVEEEKALRRRGTSRSSSTPATPDRRASSGVPGGDAPSPLGESRSSIRRSQACATPSKTRRPGAGYNTCGSQLEGQDAMELQKRLWHLQKALDAERAAHEQTREKLSKAN